MDSVLNVEKPIIDCYTSTAQIVNPQFKTKPPALLNSITLGYVHSRRGSTSPNHEKRARILFDTGCGGCLINKSLVKHLKLKTDTSTKWNTKAGSFRTKAKVKCRFIMPEFHEGRQITWKMHVEDSDPTTNRYDMIIGRGLI